MRALRQHWARIAITLVPVVLALLHAAGIWQLPFLDRLDNFIYDVRLRATMPRTLDPRIVIVDIDDPSLQQFGQWPWSRDKLARLTTELMTRQQAAVLGFDVLFVEADASSGLDMLKRMAKGPLRENAALAAEIERLSPELDHDAVLAKALAGQRVALGFYFTQTLEPRARGVLPAPVLPPTALPPGSETITRWNGFGGNIAQLSDAAPAAGFCNVLLDADVDGLVRSVPLIARYDGALAQPGYYESLALVVHRLAVGAPAITPAFASGFGSSALGTPPLEALVLGTGATRIRVPVDPSASLLVPFRGPGGPRGGSFRYVAATDVLNGALPPGELKGKIVLVGASAPGLGDLRTTPVGVAFPGVEVHANIISALLDQRLAVVPDYALGYDAATLLVAGLALAFGLSLRAAPQAVLIAGLMSTLLVGVNTWLYLKAGLVLPLAAALVMTALAFVLNMSWAYFVEARASRSLASLFGTYVPPELVDEMRANPRRYSMRAESKELTVMFCDMRGFTQLSEQLAPVELQAFLNVVFSRLTEIISTHRGTVDKYMGDCVMAFWGAPVDTPDHAALAVEAALEMAAAIHEVNDAHRRSGRPEISVGIGLNTGVMSVGDMGSAVRRSYTVVGDAVNIAARLEGVGVHYGVDIVASAATQSAAPAFVWQELDLVRVKGKAEVVQIFTPVILRRQASEAQRKELRSELERWARVLFLYRVQEWAKGQAMLAPLLSAGEQKVLYRLYAQRIASMALLPKDPDWDGATRFETK
jgi:adenylate cyclase